MSLIYGEIRQLGYVVRDIEAAMRHWIEVLGVGPWYYVERLPVRNFLYRGQPSDVHASIALANSGGAQIELIQQRNDAPSMYRDFLASGP
ncbi:MAG: VOC family protein, partial [Hyphomicrobiaceae bacterium]